MAKYTRNDAAKETEASIKEAKAAWHFARDDSGRKDNYEDKLRDPVLKDKYSQELSRILDERGIPDIQSLPSGTISSVDLEESK